jgi:multidrug resistance efflux pump
VVFPFSEATPINVPYDGVVSRSLINHGNDVVYGTGIVEIRNSLSISTVTAPRDGVVISTLPIGTQFKAGDPVAWLLPQTQQMAGREMLCYVTYNDLRKLKVGQQVQTTPANMQRENWGYAFGKVVGIENYPTTRQEIISRLKLDPLAAFIPDGQAMYEVRVTLDEKDGALVWSREKSQHVKINNGMLCNIQVITQKKPVWRVLIGAVENTAESMIGN